MAYSCKQHGAPLGLQIALSSRKRFMKASCDLTLKLKANDCGCVLGARRKPSRLECENKLFLPMVIASTFTKFTCVFCLCLRSYSIPSSQTSKKSLPLIASLTLKAINYYATDITLFRSITMLCGTNNNLKNMSHI